MFGFKLPSRLKKTTNPTADLSNNTDQKDKVFRPDENFASVNKDAQASIEQQQQEKTAQGQQAMRRPMSTSANQSYVVDNPDPSESFPGLTKEEENNIMKLSNGNKLDAETHYAKMLDLKQDTAFLKDRDAHRKGMISGNAQESDQKIKATTDKVIKMSQFADYVRIRAVQDGVIGVRNMADDKIISDILKQNPEAPKLFESYINGKIWLNTFVMGLEGKVPETNMDDPMSDQELGDAGTALRATPARLSEDESTLMKTLNWANIIGKGTESLDELAQMIPWFDVSAGISDKIDEKVANLDPQKRKEYEDNFAKDKTAQLMYGNVDNYIREKTKSFRDVLFSDFKTIPNMFVNAPWSAVKLGTALARWVTNPYDTISGLVKLVATPEWHQVILDRYGSVEAFQRSMEQDPVGVASDVLTLIGGGAKATSLGAKVAWYSDEAARLSNFSKASLWAGDAWVPQAVNKWLNMLSKGSSSIPWGQRIVNTAINISNPIWALMQNSDVIKKRATDKASGLDQETMKKVESNPYVWDYFTKLDEWVTQSEWGLTPKEVSSSLLNGIVDDVKQYHEDSLWQMGEAWPLYNDIRKINIDIDLTPAKTKLADILRKYDIDVKQDWSLDFSNSKFIKEWDTNAIQRVYERLNSKETAQPSWVLNQRQATDAMSKRDSGRPTDSTPVIREMRWAIDDIAKEKVPWLRELDWQFSKKLQQIQELRRGLFKKDGTPNENIYSTIKNILNDSKTPLRERLLEAMPDIAERIDAIQTAQKIYDIYQKDPKSFTTKLVTKWLGAVVWYMVWGAVGALGGIEWWAVASNIIAKGMKKLRDWSLWEVLSRQTPDAMKKLQEINGKIEARKSLTESDQKLLDDIRQQISDAQSSPSPKGNPPAWGETAENVANNPYADIINSMNNIQEQAKAYKRAATFIDNVKQRINGYDKKWLLYHGGTAKGDFDLSKQRVWGVRWTDDIGYATAYAGTNGEITKWLLKIDNPKIYTTEESYLKEANKATRFTEQLAKQGYDGMIIEDKWFYVVFDPSQITTETQLKKIRQEANNGAQKKILWQKFYHGTNAADAIRKEWFSIDKSVQEESSFLWDNFVEWVHLSTSKDPYAEGGQLSDVADVLEVSHLADNILKVQLDDIWGLYKKYNINTFGDNASQKLTDALKSDWYDGLQYWDEIVIFDPKKISLIGWNS